MFILACQTSTAGTSCSQGGQSQICDCRCPPVNYYPDIKLLQLMPVHQRRQSRSALEWDYTDSRLLQLLPVPRQAAPPLRGPALLAKVVTSLPGWDRLGPANPSPPPQWSRPNGPLRGKASPPKRGSQALPASGNPLGRNRPSVISRARVVIG